MSDVVAWLDKHGGVVASLGVVVGVVGAVVVWFVYRIGVRGQRKGVLNALREELDLHESWVGTSYIRGVTPPQLWHTNFRWIPFKLSTVAVDAAISTGPSLFLNHRLLTALVGYRQRVLGFNQLVDQAAVFQANPGLYRRFPSSRLVKRAFDLVGAIHYTGIGHADEDRAGEGRGMANYYFKQVRRELRCEESVRIRSLIWFVTALRTPLRRRC